MLDSLDNVDWQLLHRLKRTLLKILETRRLTPSQAEDLHCIVHLLDALQDDAAEVGMWTFPGHRRCGIPSGPTK